MKIDYPATEHIPQLRALWTASFGDGDQFLDNFHATAFSPARCRCALVDGDVAAALYWFDVSCGDAPMAYVYAVATAPAYREQGFCHALMEDTHLLLKKLGYHGILLVPDGDALTKMYAGFGYTPCTSVKEFVCAPTGDPATMHRVDTAEYARIRRRLLPAGSVIQEGENLAFLATYAELYAGPGFLLAACQDGERLQGLELLGDPTAGPGILQTLGLTYGNFRTPGAGTPFAMFLPLREDAPVPVYFGLAFD